MPNPRRIRFSLSISVIEIQRHSDYSSEEKESAWYSQDDYRRIRSERLMSLARYRQGFPETRKWSYIGLEFLLSSEHFEQRKIIKESHIQGVLKEQSKNQYLAKEYSALKLAEVSEYLSKWSNLKATEHAKKVIEDSERISVRNSANRKNFGRFSNVHRHNLSWEINKC